MKFTERFEHTLSWTKVRQMCIDNDYYTRGDCESYEKMFQMFIGKEVDVKLLKKVAQNIKDHSDTTDSTYDILRGLISLVTICLLVEEEDEE